MKKLLTFALFVALFSSACKKEVVLTNAQILQGKVWKLSAATENGTAAAIPTCTLDDKFTFSVSGSYEHNYGTTKCSGDPNTTSGNWSVDEATKVLKIVTTVLTVNKTSTYTIKSISATSFVLAYEISTLGGSTKQVEETYVPAQ